MKVCFVGGVGGNFFTNLFLALALEDVSVVVLVIPKLFVQSTTV
jgi:hypothetical protein